MRFKMRHKETGEYAIGVHETVPVTALASVFTENGEGGLLPEYEGESKVHWDGQSPEEDPMTGELFLITESADVCEQSEFERVPVEEEEDKTP